MNSASARRIYLVVALYIILIPSLAAAVSVTPASQQLTHPSTESYSFVYTVLNDDPQPRSLRLVLDPWSEYLKDKVVFSKEQFVLLPGEAQNVQVTVLPQGLGPETHTLAVAVYDADDKLGEFKLLITMSGDPPVERYALSAMTQDVSTGEAVPVHVVLENYGNIIGYAQLTLIIQQSGATIATEEHPVLYQVLPGEKKEFDLVYSRALEPGFYTAMVLSKYPTQTLNATRQFSVRLGEVTERVPYQSDMTLTFESIGNPQSVRYRLVDKNNVEVLVGSAVPENGDIILATSTLPTGKYDLYLTIQGVDDHRPVVIYEKGFYLKIALLCSAALILLGALYSQRSKVLVAWKIYSLKREVALRERQVTNLINRSHRLVDRYTALHARRQRHN